MWRRVSFAAGRPGEIKLARRRATMEEARLLAGSECGVTRMYVFVRESDHEFQMVMSCCAVLYRHRQSECQDFHCEALGWHTTKKDTTTQLCDSPWTYKTRMR